MSRANYDEDPRQGNDEENPQSPGSDDGHSQPAPPSIPDAAAATGDVVATKRVCFICGSQTSQTINIYEQRAGPNMVEVINAKFNVPVIIFV